MTKTLPVKEERLLDIADRVSRRRRIKGMEREDVMQEAYLIVLEAWRAEPDATEDRLVTQALNGLKKVYRKANRRLEAQDDEEESHLYGDPERRPEPLDVMISDETLARLPEILTPTEYRLVKMVFWEGYTDEDAAETLGQSPKGFKVTKSRTLKKLRERLLTESL